MPKSSESGTTKSNRWMFTAYNYESSNTGLGIGTWMAGLFDNCNVTYIIIGEELCQDGRPHLQGYMELGHGKDANTRKKRSTMKGLGKQLSKSKKFQEWWYTISWRIPDGTPMDQYRYCTKTRPATAFRAADEPNEVTHQMGVMMEATKVVGSKERKETMRQGERTDLDLVKAMIKDGTVTNYDTMWAATGLSCQASAMGLAHLARTEPRSLGMPIVIVAHGPTGTGKSHIASQISERMLETHGWRTYNCGTTSRWFCGYDRHEIAIIDDIRPSEWKFELLLRLLDRKPVNVEVKNGRTWWCPRMVIITAPRPHTEWYPHLINIDGDINQLSRRINENPLGGEFLLGSREGSVGRTSLLAKIDKLTVDPQYAPPIAIPQVVPIRSPGHDGHGGTPGHGPVVSTDPASPEGTGMGTPRHTPVVSPIRRNGSFATGFRPPSPTQARTFTNPSLFDDIGGTNVLNDTFEFDDWILDEQTNYGVETTTV